MFPTGSFLDSMQQASQEVWKVPSFFPSLPYPQSSLTFILSPSSLTVPPACIPKEFTWFIHHSQGHQSPLKCSPHTKVRCRGVKICKILYLFIASNKVCFCVCFIHNLLYYRYSSNKKNLYCRYKLFLNEKACSSINISHYSYYNSLQTCLISKLLFLIYSLNSN